MKALISSGLIVSFTCYLYVSIDHENYLINEEGLEPVEEYPVYHDVREINNERNPDAKEISQDDAILSENGINNCCVDYSLRLFIMDETEIEEVEAQIIFDSLQSSIESDPNLVYIYLDDYIYSSDVSSLEVYSNLIVEAGNYGIVSNYIFDAASYSDSKTLENIIALASVFLNVNDKVDFFNTIVHRSGESLEIKKAIFSLITPEWDGVDQYVSEYIYPSVNSNDRSESFWAMTKILELSAEKKYRESLLEIVDGPDEVNRELAITALEYHQKQ